MRRPPIRVVDSDNRTIMSPRANLRLPAGIHNQHLDYEHHQAPSSSSTSTVRRKSCCCLRRLSHNFQSSRLGRGMSSLSSARYNVLLLALLLAVWVLVVRPLHVLLFGSHALHGGALGRFVDYQIKCRTLRRTIARYEEHLKSTLSVELPELPPTLSVARIATIPNAVLGQLLLQAERRKQWMADMERLAESHAFHCLKSSALISPTTTAPFHVATITRTALIPQQIFTTERDVYFRNLYHFPGTQTIMIDTPTTEYEMNLLLSRHFSSLHTSYKQLATTQERKQVWVLCALYWYGGMFIHGRTLGSDLHRSLFGLVKRINHKADTSDDPSFCATPHGFVKISSNNERIVTEMAVSPGHPAIGCLLERFQDLSTLRLDKIMLLDRFAFILGLDVKEESEMSWIELPQNCPFLPLESVADKKEPDLGSALNHSILTESAYQLKKEANVVVTITEGAGTTVGDVSRRPNLLPKVTQEERFGRKWCTPSWLCHRCLKASFLGSYKRCQNVCGSCIEGIMCSKEHDSSDRRRTPVEIHVRIKIPPFNNKEEKERKLIPRIIHQTWFEELSPDRYPQLVRLQNTWKSYSGWDYRFYTDEDMRKYIVDHFPGRFLDAFDALIPGAYKADLFRYLVLLKDGGIYADIDVALNTNIDAFIFPTLSFFAPRDAVGEYANGQYCLWNGLIGVAPGHPFIIRAVERLIGLILDRADLFDMEKNVCELAGREVESWKIRAVPELLLSGPCAVGIAVNEALQRGPVDTFDAGWINDSVKVWETNHGDPVYGSALILMQDKQDLGAMRFTDLERNIIVASTDMPGLSKNSLEFIDAKREKLSHGEIDLLKRQKPHYSLAGKGDWVWGSKNVYKDQLVTNENVKLKVSYLS